MLSLLAQFNAGVGHHYGFFGIEGVFGILIGLVIFVCIAGILWKIASLIMAKFGVDSTTAQIVYWVFMLFIFLGLLHIFGLY
jgi:hypothetical protein